MSNQPGRIGGNSGAVTPAVAPVATPVQTRRPAPRKRRDATGLALAYSNGIDICEISQEAMLRFVEVNGAVPLPVTVDPDTGDRTIYDAKTGVRVVYDKAGTMREVASPGGDGTFIYITFPH